MGLPRSSYYEPSVQTRDDTAIVEAIADSARSGNESGDGLVWTSTVDNVKHNRTGTKLEKEVEA